MAADREALFIALERRLRDRLPAVKNFWRRYRDFDEVSKDQQPCLLMVGTDQTPDQSPGLPTKWTIGIDVLIYLRNDPNPSASPDTQINAYVGAVETALERQPDDPQDAWTTTLGRICQHIWISGPVKIWDGSAGDQAIVLIPLEALMLA
jgi:hypothetical protein